MTDPQARLATALADRYTILRELGAGGMATVYLAEDLKHKRKVALKVLKPELAAVLGAERFVQEITTTAALQHPHILPLFDSGTADGFLFYVMPYVQGETLRARLERERQLPVPDAVRIAREVASALDYAHRHGVIHRDIKPENILLHDGQAFVADFGIALAVQTAGGPRMTETGVSLGTPHYMSPEQAMGERALDARSDVFSLGAVSYEMLTGEPPFTGPTAQAIAGKILHSEAAPIRTIRKAVPPHVAAAVHTAIEKLPADRYASAAGFLQALDDPATTHALSRSDGPPAAGPVPTRWRAVALAAMAVAAAALIGIGWLTTRPRATAGPSEYDVALPDSASLTLTARFAVAPGGDFIVYGVDLGKGRQELWYRSLLDGTARRIEGTENAFAPLIAPDARSLSFVRLRDSSFILELLPLTGGPATVLATMSDPTDGWWLDDGRFLLIDHGGTRARWLDAGAGTSAPRRIRRCIGASSLPDGHSLLCGGGSWNNFLYRIDTQDDTLALVESRFYTAGRDSTLVFGTAFQVVDGRYLVYLSTGGDLLAAPIDLAAGRVGRSVRLRSGVAVRDGPGEGTYTLSATGTLVYASGSNRAVGFLVRQGERSLDTLPVGRAAFENFAMSHDGTRLAATVAGLDGVELRVYDLTTGKVVVVAKGAFVGQPVWSPTDDRLAYTLRADFGVEAPVAYLQTLNSTVAAEPLFDSPVRFYPYLWLSDGRLFGGTGTVVHLDRKPLTVDTVGSGIWFTPSPDGRWVLYVKGGYIWLEPLPGNGKRYPVAAGGADLQWLSPTEVAFRVIVVPTRFERVTIFPSRDVPVGPRRSWLEAPRWVDTPDLSATVTPDGRLIYKQADLEARPQLRVVPNWVATMKRAVDEANRAR